MIQAFYLLQKYRKRGKIRWDKHSRFQPYEVFRGVYLYTLAKYSRENFRGSLKNRESLVQWIFPYLRYW